GRQQHPHLDPGRGLGPGADADDPTPGKRRWQRRRRLAARTAASRDRRRHRGRGRRGWRGNADGRGGRRSHGGRRMSQEVSVAASYFGKVPSRGDFVRTADNHPLMALLDRWAGGGIELLSGNPDWKRLYDQTPDVYYGFMGSRSRLVVCGHFLPSRDVSQRRFPLLSAIRVEVADPLGFIARSPMALSRAWSGLSRRARDAVEARDAGAPLQVLARTRHDLCVDPAAYAAPFDDFLELQTIGSLQRLLRGSGHGEVAVRRLLPALGLLLQPVLSGSGVAIDKGLELPLPADPLYR